MDKLNKAGCGAAPAKHSTRQISEVLERIDLLYALDFHKHLADIPDLILRRYRDRTTQLRLAYLRPDADRQNSYCPLSV